MDNRLERITLASFVGIVLNLSLVVVKMALGIVSGSVSILTDAVNNMTDTMSAVVTLVGVKLARKKPDRKHPHGHGRIEYIAALVVGLIILGVGIVAAFESIPKITKPVIASYSVWTVVVIFVAVVAKLLYGRYLIRVGKATKSRSLEGSGVDALFDALLSFGTLVGAAISLLFGVSVDGWIGLIISAFIVKSAFEILSEGVTDIIGRRADDRLARRIREKIRNTEGIKGIKSLVLHDYGPEDVSGIARVKVNRRLSVNELTKISERLEREIKEEFGVDLIVGV
ncbi:cation transporter [Candidatus Saccharibacteria bacterium]|nr:cation transporter [Candidatus Saccharibacteria bacterium]